MCLYCDRVHVCDSFSPFCLVWQTKFPFDIIFIAHHTDFTFLCCAMDLRIRFCMRLSLPLSSSPVCLVACHDSAFVLLSVAFLPKLLLALRALLFLFEVRICTHNMNDNKDKSGIKSESTLKIEWIIAVHLYTRTLLLFSSHDQNNKKLCGKNWNHTQSQRRSETGWADRNQMMISKY